MNTSPLSQTRSGTLAQRVRPVVETIFDYLTLEPIWRAYRRMGKRGAAAVVIGLWFVWAFIIVVPMAIIGGLLQFAGLVESAGNAVTTPVLLLATAVTAYGSYTAYQFITDRRTVYSYRQNLDLEKAGECFEYLDSDDNVVRGLASASIADAMSQSDSPGRVINQGGLSTEEAAFTLVDLLHDDDNDVRRNASEAVAYLSRESALKIAPYRDDVFAAMTYPDSMIQTNAAIIAGNMAQIEPRLSDEVVDNLGPLVSDENPDVRHGMAVALGMIHTDRSKQLLEQLAGDSNSDVRAAANEALKRQQQGRPVDADVETG